MKNKINIECSARHCHLTRKDIDFLFGKGYKLTPIKELSQKGQFIAKERVDLMVNNKVIKNIAIILPEREKTQIEISLTDSIFFKKKVYVCLSGNLNKAKSCYLIKDNKKLFVKKGLIVAQNHIHCDLKTAKRLNLKDYQKVNVLVNSDRNIVFNDVVVRVNKDYTFKFHIDTDEANACCNAKYGQIII